MTKRKFVISLLIFVLYVTIACAGAWFLAGEAFSLVAFVLIAVGVTLWIVYLLIARIQAPPAPTAGTLQHRVEAAPGAGTSGPDDPDLAVFHDLIANANNQLARSPTLASRGIKTAVTRLPLFLLGGTEGSGKTSAFLKCGLDPELLAGQVFRESKVVPTQLANLWFAEDSLFAEFSGRVLSGNSGLWKGMLDRLQGRSAGGFIRSIFRPRTGSQLRGCVLFCDIAPFIGVPDASRLGGLGRRIQERLRLAGESFGSNFPVYVIFTKCDAVPKFPEFFSRLVENEDQQILGCTLPMIIPSARPAGEVYAEAETARLSETFNALYYSLADKRLTTLPRETSSAVRLSMYEFPREMKRIRDTVIQFLVDAFRPNPLQPGPILRGFYFTGTRQVVTSALGPNSFEPARGLAADPTLLFNLAEYQKRMGQTMSQPDAPVETTTQRWCFVAELFHRVLLQDPMGRLAVLTSQKQARYKRILLGSLAGLALVVSLLWIRSWWDNASLLSSVEAAVQTGENVQSKSHGAPSRASLKALDELREQLQPLISYEQDGAPLRMRWGLYAGDKVLPSAYALYFHRFRQLFFNEIKASITTNLEHLPLSPDLQHPYSDAYNGVKAYRMITQGKCSPDPTFLTSVLDSNWIQGHSLDDESRVLALKQLAFYAVELKRKNPYNDVGEVTTVVQRGQAYLSSFGGSSERVYSSLIEGANQSHPAANLAELAPNYKEVLISPGTVPGAFTKDGWISVESAIKDPNNLKTGDNCVVGLRNNATSLLATPHLQTDLENFYIRDYIRHWKDFIAGTRVVPFANAADASKKLDTLSNNRSPLLAAIFMVGDNTNFQANPATAGPSGLIDKMISSKAKKAVAMAKEQLGTTQKASIGDIGRIFQPARAVVSTEHPENRIGDLNQAYMNALTILQGIFQRLQNDHSSTPDIGLNKEGESAVYTGLAKAKEIAQHFNTEGADLRWLLDMVNGDSNRPGVDSSLNALLEAPFKNAQPLLNTDIGAGAGAALRRFCARLAPLQRKFPFSISSDVDASTDEMAKIFSPTGALGDLVQSLSKLIIKQGKQWMANPASQDLHPTGEFLTFITQMQRIQDTLFADGSLQFKMQYSLKAVPDQNEEAIILDVDGQKVNAVGGAAQSQLLSWPGSGQVTVTVRAGANIPFGSYSGPWAVLHWMYDSDARTAGSKTVQWSSLRQGHGQLQKITDAQGQPIVVRVEISEFPSGNDLFDRNFFNIHCPSKAVQ